MPHPCDIDEGGISEGGATGNDQFCEFWTTFCQSEQRTVGEVEALAVANVQFLQVMAVKSHRFDAGIFQLRLDLPEIEHFNAFEFRGENIYHFVHLTFGPNTLYIKRLRSCMENKFIFLKLEPRSFQIPTYDE